MKIIDEIEGQGSKINIFRITSIPKYSFVRFDERKTFIILSTFAQRRSSVPAIEIRSTGIFNDLVSDCIKAARANNTE